MNVRLMSTTIPSDDRTELRKSLSLASVIAISLLFSACILRSPFVQDFQLAVQFSHCIVANR